MKEHWTPRTWSEHYILNFRHVITKSAPANYITRFNYNIYSDYHNIYNYYDKSNSVLPIFPTKFIKEYNDWQNIKKAFIENYQNESKLKSLPQSVQNKINKHEYKYK